MYYYTYSTESSIPRRTGVTTRTVNKSVEKLFSFGVITVPSFHDIDNFNQWNLLGTHPNTTCIDPMWFLTPNVQTHLFQRIIKRLENEHSDAKYIVDKGRKTISL